MRSARVFGTGLFHCRLLRDVRPALDGLSAAAGVCDVPPFAPGEVFSGILGQGGGGT